MNKKQKLIAFIGAFSLLVTFLIVKNRTTQTISDTQTNTKKVNTVDCTNIKQINTKPLIELSGRITSSNKINIISEVNGVSKVQYSRFEVGEIFKKGEILLSIEDGDIELELKSIKSQFLALLLQVLPDVKMDFPSLGSKLQSYVNNFNLDAPIPNLPEITQLKARNFFASRQVFANYYTIQSLEKRINKFKIKAPFDGVLTKVLIDPGSSIIIGQPLGEFINLNTYEMNGSVSVNDSKLIEKGDTVLISSNDLNAIIKGNVSRVGSHINELTQSVDVFVSVNDNRIKDGMFITGKIICNTLDNVVKIERSKITKENQVYTIVDNKLKLKNIDIICYQNDSVIISGLNISDCVVNQYRNYFYDNMLIN